eukprot:TRINITY_DN6271_c0_g1_i1.p1 TRINITY_DN6271_c0_g1~~TRINITY_DN6271_c0_g1_i1.p1  ORF type:complete len:449 (-),score=99.97 TRINITY_DN6271_c0_g1_i1:22-1368(-)
MTSLNAEFMKHMKSEVPDFDEIVNLLNKKADINCKDNHHNVVLYYACDRDNPDLKIIKYLVENKADMNYKNRYENNPLLISVMKCHFEVVKYMSENGANLNLRRYTDKGHSLLLACGFDKQYKKEIIEVLVKNKANINFQDEEGFTPLYYACTRPNPSFEVIKILIDNKADPNIKANNTHTPLYTCCTNPSTTNEMIKYVVNGKGDVRMRTKMLETPLYAVCNKMSINLDMVKFMVENKGDPNHKPLDGKTPLFQSCTNPNKRFEITKFLVDAKGNPNIQAPDGYSSFLVSCNVGKISLETIKYLVEVGNANVNLKNKKNENAIYLLMKSRDDYSDVLKYLLSIGVDPDCKSTDGPTALILSAQHYNCYRMLAEIILKKNPQKTIPNYRPQNNNTNATKPKSNDNKNDNKNNNNNNVPNKQIKDESNEIWKILKFIQPKNSKNNYFHY